MRKSALLLLSEPARARAREALEAMGYEVRAASGLEQARESLRAAPATLVVAVDAVPDLPGTHGWIVVRRSLEASHDHEEALRLAGALELIPPGFDARRFQAGVAHAERCLEDPLFALADAIERITGVQLLDEKRSLIETRLTRRIRALGLPSREAYADRLRRFREQELREAISLVTTHTTDFFREPTHFDYLHDHFLPELFKAGPPARIRVWSAASSTGQEAYSLAIALLEFCRARGIPEARLPCLEIHGTDVDAASVRAAAEGVYRLELLERLRADLLDRYFDMGKGELAGFARIKDRVHRHCRFAPLNLMADSFPFQSLDLVFLRNVAIYFKPDDVRRIVTRISKCLAPHGLLFLGHSETLASTDCPFRKVGDAIYAPTAVPTLAPPPAAPAPVPGPAVPAAPRLQPAPRVPSPGGAPAGPALIVLGASTGGVEALKAVLEGLPAECPPVLIVQHIPAEFSKTFARRLNETCPIAVSEAVNGEEALPSHAYIAPGGKQMKVIRRAGGSLVIEVNDDPPVRRHRPSVDYLFQSVIPVTRHCRVVAALLTGMGSDGARGLAALRAHGAHTVAQDEATCVVYGMPAEAVRLDAACEVAPLSEIAGRLMRALSIGRRAA